MCAFRKHILFHRFFADWTYHTWSWFPTKPISMNGIQAAIRLQTNYVCVYLKSSVSIFTFIVHEVIFTITITYSHGTFQGGFNNSFKMFSTFPNLQAFQSLFYEKKKEVTWKNWTQLEIVATFSSWCRTSCIQSHIHCIICHLNVYKFCYP